MHGLWNTWQQYRREACNAYCDDRNHAMVIWSNHTIDDTAESICGWNPEVEILAVESAPEAPVPEGLAGQFIRGLELCPLLVRFRIVMDTPEAA